MAVAVWPAATGIILARQNARPSAQTAARRVTVCGAACDCALSGCCLAAGGLVAVVCGSPGQQGGGGGEQVQQCHRGGERG